jgi:hypothetical protein
VIWLSRFFADPIIDRRETRAAWIARAGVLAAVIAVIGVIVKRSIDYHAIYRERIEAQARAIETQHDQPKQQEPTRDGKTRQP